MKAKASGAAALNVLTAPLFSFNRGGCGVWLATAGRMAHRFVMEGPMPIPTRKQVYDLTLADFDAAPVWEFALDEEAVPGQDETTVRPYEAPGPPLDRAVCGLGR
jgi:hypothetical protein